MPFKYNLAGIIGNTDLGLQVYPDVYPTPRSAYPGRLDGPIGRDGRPSVVIYQRPLTEAWILQDAENWA